MAASIPTPEGVQLPFASTCACGRPTYSFGGLCDRCVALKALELPTTATAAQIENSYLTLAKVWHPDRFQHDPKLREAAEEKLKEINAAHDYLTSEAAQEPPPKSQSRTQPPPRPQEPIPQAVEMNEDPEPEAYESEDVRRILKRRRRSRLSSLPKILLQTGVIVGAVATVAILWLVIDAMLMSSPKTAGPWEQYKTEMGRDLHSMGLRMWSDATENLHNQKGSAATTTEPPASPSATAPQSPSETLNAAPATQAPTTSRPAGGGPPHIKVGESGKGAQPYVTSGLTPTEVLAILGTPTSSSGEKMLYNGSEIDFKNGRVAGWKVDAQSRPIRVKLWPTTAPPAGLSQFALGSSKSDVIALQGTPTLFSDNKFGYGSSVVFFQNDRVVGWKEDPNSVRLRVAH